MLVGASMNLIGSIGLKVLLANHQSRVYSRIQLLTVLLTNIGLIIGSSSQSPLKGMLFSSLVLPHLIGISCLIVLISFDERIQLSIGKVSVDVIKKLFSAGKFFLVLQIATIVNYQIDSLLIAHFLGQSELAEYNVVLRMGSVPFILVSAAVLPIWAITANLYAKGKSQEALEGLYGAIVKVLVFSFASMILFILFGAHLINVWTLQQIQPSVELVFANALWIPLSCVMQLFAMYLNGAKAYRFLLISTIVFSFSNFMVAVFFLRFYANISGPMWSNSISSLLFFIVPAMILFRRKSNIGRGS